jgi:surfeit locus 1 family protein
VTGTFRRLLWPGLMTAGMMIVLLGLGTWQVKRLFWKQALLAQIERAESADPMPLAQVEVRSAPSQSGATRSEPVSFTPSPFMKVSVTGTFLPDETALYGAEVRDIASGPAMGAQLIEPMRQAGGDLILIDRGWVPLSRPGPLDQPPGVATVSGYVRFGDTPGWFSATDDLAARHFFTLDPKAIGNAIGQPDIRPFVLVALAAGAEPGLIVDHWPDPARHLPRPPNNHFSYAITWYGLAVALLAIFTVWARKGSRA